MRSVLKLFVRLLSTALAAGFCASGATFIPGADWLDTDGRPINAHGGGVLLYGGSYYWYGEFKTGRTYLPDCNKSWGGTRVDTTGVSCYTSTNLADWNNAGIVLAATPQDPEGDLAPGKVLERPKVAYNQATHTFVMWMHIDAASYASARCGVAVSDRPTGPFQYLGSFRPNAETWPDNATAHDQQPSATNYLARDFHTGQMARDMTVFVDDDGHAYLFYSSEENPTMHVALLTDDYLRPAGKYARIFIGRSMEAPAVFKHAGKYYLIGSACTAWAPNAARSAVADHPLGPWTELGNPCTGPDATNTFHAQSTFVLPLPGHPDQFVFMADQWKQWDLPNSRYLWLPLEISGEGKPIVRWQDRWSLNN